MEDLVSKPILLTLQSDELSTALSGVIVGQVLPTQPFQLLRNRLKHKSSTLPMNPCKEFCVISLLLLQCALIFALNCNKGTTGQKLITSRSNILISSDKQESPLHFNYRKCIKFPYISPERLISVQTNPHYHLILSKFSQQ